MVFRGPVLAGVLLVACGTPEPGASILEVDVPLHLEAHLEDAAITGSDVPEDVIEPLEWRFDRPQPEWRPVVPRLKGTRATEIVPTAESWRIRLRHPPPESPWIVQAPDGIYIDLPDWDRDDWAWVEIQARAQGVSILGIAMNLPTEGLDGLSGNFTFPGEQVDVVNDGAVHTYRLRADWSWRSHLWPGVWRQLAVLARARAAASGEGATLDLISVRMVPKETSYVANRVGVSTEVRRREYRNTVYSHTPGTVEYEVRIPPAGRLDFGLGVLRDVPVRFKVTARLQDGGTETLFEEDYADKENWAQKSVDLSHLEDQNVRLGLEAQAERIGSVALWATPTVSGTRRTGRPNVIFYVIDGGAASQMSVYGYNRRTTPNLERLAARGAVFENAYSNSSWTRPSTASFMSSLQHSTLGGLRDFRNPVPAEVPTMAEHLHRAGFQTAVLATNPNAGTMSGLDRGADVLREDFASDQRGSSRQLHELFWQWRASYPGAPFWVHFQTTDVHEYDDGHNRPPFAGLFVARERRRNYLDQRERLSDAGGTGPYSEAFEKLGIDRPGFFEVQRDLYDEAMAQQDDEIGRLVDRLRASGDWDNTLLIVAADHSFLAAGDEDFSIGVLPDLPPQWDPSLRPSVSRIPMIFVWPGRIPAGNRFRDPVSMIDMLPTILELLDLPPPEVLQGQSLAPLLLEQGTWQRRPVILDEFVFDERAGQLGGVIGIVDGRWGALLAINPFPTLAAVMRRPSSLLLYDLWEDPLCQRSLHQERPELVAKYKSLLEKQFQAHLLLGEQLTRGQASPLTPEQLRTLRKLGYIQ